MKKGRFGRGKSCGEKVERKTGVGRGEKGGGGQGIISHEEKGGVGTPVIIRGGWKGATTKLQRYSCLLVNHNLEGEREGRGEEVLQCLGKSYGLASWWYLS